MLPFADKINLLERQPLFLTFHRWLIPKARIGVRVLQWYAGLALVPVLAALLVMWQVPDLYYPFFDSLARKFGEIAAILYSITLIPGMLRRFGIFPLTRSILMIWRRYFGIAMFHSALTHQFLIRSIPLFFINPELIFQPDQQALYGFLSLLLLFPLWLTSNDLSVKSMGKVWHWVHALTYIALFSIYLHVMLATSGLIQKGLLAILVLEILSWIVRWFQRPPAPVTSSTSQVPPPPTAGSQL